MGPSLEASLALLFNDTRLAKEKLASMQRSMQDLEDAFLDGRLKGSRIAMTQGKYPHNWFRPELMLDD